MLTVYFKALTEQLMHGVATPFTYPGAELHLKDIADLRDSSTVWIADVRGAQADDLVYAALLADVAHQRQAPFVLFLPYLPAARSDRGEPTGVRVYAELVNSMNPQQVIGVDAHSPYVHRYLRNLTEVRLTRLVREALGYKDARRTDWRDNAEHYDAVIAPDKGAMARAAEVAGALGRYGVDVYHAEKERDFETGAILSIKMAEKLPQSGKYLVVDDICDGGGTFMGLAQATGLLREQLGLWVTHGIFSGKAIELRRYYRHIYTTDSHPGHARAGCATVVVRTETYLLDNLKKFG